MIRKKAISEFIQECWENGWEATIIVEELENFIKNPADTHAAEEVEILRRGEVVD